MKSLSSSVNLPELEDEVLAKWEEEQTFYAQEAKRSSAKEDIEKIL